MQTANGASDCARRLALILVGGVWFILRPRANERVRSGLDERPVIPRASTDRTISYVGSFHPSSTRWTLAAPDPLAPSRPEPAPSEQTADQQSAARVGLWKPDGTGNEKVLSICSQRGFYVFVDNDPAVTSSSRTAVSANSYANRRDIIRTWC